MCGVWENPFGCRNPLANIFASSGLRGFMSCFIFAYLCISGAHKSSNLRSQMSGKSQLSFSDQYPNLKLSFRVVRSRCKMKHYGTCDFSMSCFILAYLCMSGAHQSSNLHSLRSGESQLSCSDQYSYHNLSF